jgi:hypothetical protein
VKAPVPKPHSHEAPENVGHVAARPEVALVLHEHEVMHVLDGGQGGEMSRNSAQLLEVSGLFRAASLERMPTMRSAACEWNKTGASTTMVFNAARTGPPAGPRPEAR